MKKPVDLALRLFSITAVAALALSFTNSKTAPIIEQAQKDELNASLAVVYQDGKDFEEVKDGELPDGINGVYRATGGSKDGYVFDITSKGGYGGPIEFILGVDDDLKITGFKTLNHSESAGFGAKMDEPEFNDGMVGTSLDKEVGYSQDGSGENDITGITGATYTTTSVVSGINAAREYIESAK